MRAVRFGSYSIEGPWPECSPCRGAIDDAVALVCVTPEALVSAVVCYGIRLGLVSEQAALGLIALGDFLKSALE